MTERGYPLISAEERVRPTGRETPRPPRAKAGAERRESRSLRRVAEEAGTLGC